MGVFTRSDSKFYWIYLERGGGHPGIKERTDVLKAPTNRGLAERVYQARMRELAETRHFAKRTLYRPRLDKVGWCYIYFVTDGDKVKIGRAVNVLARLRAMQTGHPGQLRVMAAFVGQVSLEATIHGRFRHLRLSNRTEWFRLDDDLRAFIERIGAGIDPTAELLNTGGLPAEGETISEH